MESKHINVVIVVGICLVLGGSLFFIPDMTVDRFRTSTTIWVRIVVAAVGFLGVFVASIRNSVVLSSLFLLSTVSYILFLAINGTDCGWTLFMIIYFYTLYNAVNSLENAKLIIAVSLIVAALLLILFGFCQCIGCFRSFHNQYPMTATFDNPAAMACFLAIVFPVSLFFCESHNKKIRFLAVLVSVLILVATLLLESRTAVLSIAVTLIGCFGYAKMRKKHFITTVLLLFIGLLLLYSVNPDSANGRLLTWICSFRIFSDHCLTGIGVGHFEKEYMMSQAAFFQQYPASEMADVADNVKYPFNEFIRLLVEQGLVGGVLLVGILVYAIRRCMQIAIADRKVLVLCAIAFLICSLFSYILAYPVFQVLLITLLAFMLSDSVVRNCMIIRNYRIGRWVRAGVIALLSVWLLLDTLQMANSEIAWKQAYTIAEEQEVNEDTVERFTLLYKDGYLSRSADFLYNYAVILFTAGHYKRCHKVLIETCHAGANDYNTRILLGYNHLALGEPDKAEATFEIASSMIPRRLLPRYELMNLYHKNGRGAKAIKQAKEILKLPVKLETPKVLFMKKMAKEYMSNYEKGKEVILSN